LPVIGFYLDAANYQDHLADNASFAALRSAEHRHYESRLALVRINRPYEAGQYVAPKPIDWFQNVAAAGNGFAPRPWLPINKALHSDGWIERLFTTADAGPQSNIFFKPLAGSRLVAMGGPEPPLDDKEAKAKGMASAELLLSANGVCVDTFDASGKIDHDGDAKPFECRNWAQHNRLVVPGDLYEWTRLALLVFLLLATLWFAFHTVSQRLFGAGIPIESVDYPLPAAGSHNSDSGAPGAGIAQAPTEKFSTIIGLAGDRRDWYFDQFDHFDLFDWPGTGGRPFPRANPRRPDEQSGDLAYQVLYNLELTLRDGNHRRAVLRFLEGKVAEARRNANLRLVLLADLTPLERLMQASEEEIRDLKSAKGEDPLKELADVRRYREDVRWSRLFEEFRTYIYQPGNALSPGHAPKPDAETALDPEVWKTVARELAPLPVHVIRSLLPDDGRTRSAGDRWHLDIDELQNEVARWASMIRNKGDIGKSAPEPAAVINFLALMLIEHYQLCWAISSHAERLVLLNLAHGRAVSIVAAATPLRSLVRRGLVVLDPVPRLMNDSFREFALQSENLWAFADYQREAPQGSWGRAQIPLLLFLPLALVALGYAILDSGLGVQSLIPLAVAAVPSLLQSVGGIRRATGA
jgi:hypothetical protein